MALARVNEVSDVFREVIAHSVSSIPVDFYP